MPADLARNKERAEAFARAWRRHVGPGPARLHAAQRGRPRGARRGGVRRRRLRDAGQGRLGLSQRVLGRVLAVLGGAVGDVGVAVAGRGRQSCERAAASSAASRHASSTGLHSGSRRSTISSVSGTSSRRVLRSPVVIVCLGRRFPFRALTPDLRSGNPAGCHSDRRWACRLLGGSRRPRILAHSDRADHRQHRRQVEQLRRPVTGVGEQRRHAFSAADNSHSPRQVNATIRTSMTTCERVACARRAVELERAVVGEHQRGDVADDERADLDVPDAGGADDAVVDASLRRRRRSSSRRRAGRWPAATGPGRCRPAARSSGRRGSPRRSGSACGRTRARAPAGSGALRRLHPGHAERVDRADDQHGAREADDERELQREARAARRGRGRSSAGPGPAR